MSTFRIQPHGRLHEWVAEENGYFRDEGLDYEFVGDDRVGAHGGYASVQSAEAVAPEVRNGAFESVAGAPEVRNGAFESVAGAPEVRNGAFESIEEGRACEISSACHWAVNMASSAQHGRMWGHAYWVTPAAIVVPPESTVHQPTELAGYPVGVGYHSGSHFSALQALGSFLSPGEINLDFIGLPQDRLAALLDRKVLAANVFGVQLYVLQQQGFRTVVDTSFMIGSLFSNDADIDDVAKFFNALRRAQRDIDLEPERYKHYFLKHVPERYHDIVDVRTFGTGERVVFEDYTREMYDRTHRWMEELQIFPPEQVGHAPYDTAVAI